MKKINLILKSSTIFPLIFLTVVFFTCCKKTKQEEASPVIPSGSTTQSLKQTSSTLGDIGNGVNLQPSYFNNGNSDLGWGLMMQNTKIQTVRIEIEPGQETNAKRWIAEAKANGYKVIVTYHKSSVLGSDSAAELLDAATWWKNNYNNLGGGFIVNLMNEWGSHNISAPAYATAYNAAITEVRKVYNGSILSTFLDGDKKQLLVPVLLKAVLMDKLQFLTQKLYFLHTFIPALIIRVNHVI